MTKNEERQTSLETPVLFIIQCAGTEFWEGDATKHKSVKSSAFSLSEVKAFSE